MSICPQCKAKSEATATVCRSCGQSLQPATPAADAELPAWLRQLKPDSAPAPADDKVLDTAPVGFRPAATPAIADPADSPASAAPPRARAASDEAPPRQRSAPEPGAPAPRPTTPPAAMTPTAEKPTTNQAESASLVTEDDLPSWLRAFSDKESEKPASAPVSEGQSWLSSVAGADNAEGADKIANSWQAPSQPAARRHSDAGSLFARVAEHAPATGAPRVEHPTPVVRAASATGASSGRAAGAGRATASPTAAGEGRPRTAVRSAGGGGSNVAVYAAVALIVLLVLIGIAAKLLGIF